MAEYLSVGESPSGPHWHRGHSLANAMLISQMQSMLANTDTVMQVHDDPFMHSWEVSFSFPVRGSESDVCHHVLINVLELILWYTSTSLFRCGLFLLVQSLQNPNVFLADL